MMLIAKIPPHAAEVLEEAERCRVSVALCREGLEVTPMDEGVAKETVDAITSRVAAEQVGVVIILCMWERAEENGVQ